MKRLGVFCGSNPAVAEVYKAAARDFATAAVQAGYGIVYGGASIGLMGAVADAALAAGGAVYGVIPQFLVDAEIAHTKLTEQVTVQSMADRKDVMAELSCGFVSLPGGLGTLDELFEMMTWQQLRLHRKPNGLLNTTGYYDPLLQMLKRAVDQAFVPAASLEDLVVGETADAVLAGMAEQASS